MRKNLWKKLIMIAAASAIAFSAMPAWAFEELTDGPAAEAGGNDLLASGEFSADVSGLLSISWCSSPSC